MKRFYKTVSIDMADDGFSVVLDGRAVKTPAKVMLIVPTKALADAIAAEWDGQGEDIRPQTMPLTQLANTALDRVQGRRQAILQDMAGFARSDMLCYREASQRPLQERQNALWSPYLMWAKSELGADMAITSGVMPIEQSREALTSLAFAVEAHDSFELTALHGLTTAFGSLILGLACASAFTTLDEIWRAAIIDETYQAELWGMDHEAQVRLDNLLGEATHAHEFLNLVRS